MSTLDRSIFCKPFCLFGSKMNSVPKSLTRWNGYNLKLDLPAEGTMVIAFNIIRSAPVAPEEAFYAFARPHSLVFLWYALDILPDWVSKSLADFDGSHQPQTWYWTFLLKIVSNKRKALKKHRTLYPKAINYVCFIYYFNSLPAYAARVYDGTIFGRNETEKIAYTSNLQLLKAPPGLQRPCHYAPYGEWHIRGLVLRNFFSE